MDVLPYFDFDFNKFNEYLNLRNPNATVIPISAKTGDGIEKVAEYIKKEITEWRKK
jgi:hydrogenase nickel incorporation protein HypB